ncbi:MAG TPA: hypothetical protein VEK15_06495, partial [Vicinamibacteria bacterium]|nr:hypothetical protein [Vicinamibacteria bacterium]
PIWTYHPVAEKRQVNVLTASSLEAFLEASKSNLSQLHPVKESLAQSATRTRMCGAVERQGRTHSAGVRGTDALPAVTTR